MILPPTMNPSQEEDQDDQSHKPLTLTDHQENHSHHNSSTLFITQFLEPFQWLKMLASTLNPTFVLGVVLVYGLGQGFSASFFKVVSDYYWKDVQRVQPSTVQLFVGLYYIPWLMKPVWGLLTDVFPVRGYHRRPYFVLAGVVGVATALPLAAGGAGLAVVVALTCMIGITAGLAIADVTIDACIARNSIEIRSLAADMQTLCGFCSSAGALAGFSTSGFFVHHLGPQVALGLLAIPAASLIALGFVIYEPGAEDIHIQRKKPTENLIEAVRGMYRTMQIPQVWKPSLYMYLSLALSISTHEGQFYWYTDSTAGPAFSQEFVGMIYAIGATASIVGVVIYHKAFKDYPFRTILFCAQLLYALAGMIDLVFILRWNLVLGIPDYFFIVLEVCISWIITRIRWMPMMVLSSQLCPAGIEGTFFALLMCIDSLGGLTSKSAGGLLLHLLLVTRTDFSNLWLAILIRNILRLSVLALVFLVPNVVPSEVLIPADVLKEKNKVSKAIDEEESLQMVPLNERTDRV